MYHPHQTQERPLPPEQLWKDMIKCAQPSAQDGGWDGGGNQDVYNNTFSGIKVIGAHLLLDSAKLQKWAGRFFF